MTGFNSDLTVAGVHRTIRTLAEDEGPFEGDLVTRTGGMAVRVDAERLRGWAGWTFAGAEHVVAPVDIALRADGQDVLLPWCVRTVRTSLAQATEAGGISHGEAVTLAVSILRGVLELDGGQHDAELDRRHSRADGAGDERHGSWWLTDEARPVFVIDAPGADMRRERRVRRASGCCATWRSGSRIGRSGASSRVSPKRCTIRVASALKPHGGRASCWRSPRRGHCG